MGEMVGEVRLICGRVAESGSNWRVAPQSPLELGPLGTVTASYYRITSRAAGPWSSSAHHNAATIMGTALCAAAHQLARTLETPSKKQCLSPQVKIVGS